MSRRITAKQWHRLLQDEATERDDRFGDRWTRLERKLLALGGSRVILQGRELFAARLLQRGQVFNRRIEVRHGEPHRCHGSSAAVWARGVDRFRLVTGYALMADRWVSHSWVLEGKLLV